MVFAIQKLKSRRVSLSFIVLGNENDIPQAVSMIRAGAFEFIDKPFTDHKLLRVCKKRMSDSEKQQHEKINE